MTTEFQKKILRPYGKWLDIILLAWVLTFLLMTAGQELGHLVLKIPAANSALDSLTGDADTTAFLDMYLDFFGIWIISLAIFFCYRPDRPMFKAIGHNRRGNTLRMGFTTYNSSNVSSIIAMQTTATIMGTTNASVSSFMSVSTKLLS